MKTLFSAIALVTSTFLISNKAKAQTNAKADIEQLIFAYRDALNASDTKLLLSLYSEGGVFMPIGFRTLSGKEKIKQSSERFFKKRRINLAFEIRDNVIEKDFAFVQAHSKCNVYQLSTGAEETCNGKDFFVLKNYNTNGKYIAICSTTSTGEIFPAYKIPTKTTQLL